MASSADTICTMKVFEVTLGKNTSDGPGPSGITIKFALSAEPRGDTDMDELQATDGVISATEVAVSALGPSPQVTRLLISPINSTANVVSKDLTFENLWGVLLHRINFFSKLAADIPEVFLVQYRGFSISTPRRFAHMHPWLGQLCPLRTRSGCCWVLLLVLIAGHDFKQVVNQENCDERTIRLVGTMSDALTFVHNAEPFKVVKTQSKTVTRLIQQVTECGYFITAYTKHKNLCQSPFG